MSVHSIIIIIYFASAAVAVDSSQTTASSFASWSRFSPPSNCVNGHVSTMWFMVCRGPQSQECDWARPHFVQASTTWALTCPETVRRRQRMTREIRPTALYHNKQSGVGPQWRSNGVGMVGRVQEPRRGRCPRVPRTKFTTNHNPQLSVSYGRLVYACET